MSVTTHKALMTPSQTVYQLDPEQTLRASEALLEHIRNETERVKTASAKKDLLDVGDSDAEDELDPSEDVPVWLTLTTKQHIVDKNRLKPSRIPVPHSLNASPDLKICIITADPQRAVKNAVADPTFPSSLSSRITRVIGLTKLKARYKSFEQRRELLSEHDIFLADDRIVNRLPSSLGKVFYKGTAKRPIPISIAEQRRVDGKRVKSQHPGKKSKEDKDAAIASPAVVVKEIIKAIDSIPVSLRPGTHVALRVGRASFSPQQLRENVTAAVEKLIEKHVVKGWKNVKAVHVKSPTSMSIPIWLADELWAENGNVDDVDDLVQAEPESDHLKRKRHSNTKKGPQAGSRKRVKVDRGEQDAGPRREKLSAQKAAILRAEAIAA